MDVYSHDQFSHNAELDL